MTTQHLTEEEINAYLDGECTTRERSDAAAHIEACADCAATLADLSLVKQMVRQFDAVELPRSFVLPADFAHASPVASPATGAPTPLRGNTIRRFEPAARWLSIAAVLAFLVLGAGQLPGWLGDDTDSSSNVALNSETGAPTDALQVEEEPALARGELREQGDSAATGAGTLASQPARVDTPVQVDTDLTPLEITTVGIGVVALVAIASWILIHYRAGSAG